MATFLQRANFSGTNGSHFFLDIYQDNSQSIDGNASAIRYYAYVGAVGGYRGSGSSSPVRINGQIVGYFSSISANSNTLIGYLDVIVNHDDEGKASASYTASADTNWSLGDASISGLFTLPTIPRADRVTAPTTVYVEKTYTITTTQNSGSFTHTIKYSCGNVSGTIATGVDSSCSWTLPKELYQTFPNSSYAQGKYICETYSGSKLIGTTETTFYVYADRDLSRPTHTFEYNTTDSVSSTLTGSSKGIIKGISDISYTITGNPKYGASIQNYYLSTAKNYPEVSNSGTIKNVTSNKYYVSVRDTRGLYSVQTEQTLSPFVDYTMLAITYLSFERENELSSNVYMNLKGNYFNGNFGATNNSLSVKLFFKKNGESDWGNAIDISSYAEINGNTFEIKNQLVASSFSFEESYDFRIVLQDKVFTDDSISTNLTLTKGIALLDIGENDILFHGTKILEYIESKVKLNVDLFYPVGTAIFNKNKNFDPNEVFPGTTWKNLGNCVLMGCEENSDYNSPGTYTGNNTHTMTLDELVNHYHGFIGASAIVTRPDMGIKGLGAGNLWVEGVGTITTTSVEGGTQPFSIVQRSYLGYWWERTS